MKPFFDTLRFALPENVKYEDVERLSLEKELNFRYLNGNEVGISIDETTNPEDINQILEVFGKAAEKSYSTCRRN